MVHESVRTSPTDYETAIRKIWGNDADAAPWPTKVRTKNPEPRLIWHLPMVGLKAAEVLKQYPLSRFEGSPQKAFLQVDADSMVICPSYQLLGRNFCLCISTDQVVTFCEACFSLSLGFFNIRRRDFCSREWDACISFWKLATFCNLLYKIMFFFFLGCQAAGIPSWAFQFAHFIPSQRPDGWGCSNGPELDVAPPSRGAYTTLSQTESWSCYCFEKLQQRQNLHNHLGDQGSFLQFMVMMQLGAFFFLSWIKLIQLASFLFIILHKRCTTDSCQPFLFLCAKSSPRWSSFLETKLVLMGLDLPTTGLYVLFHLGSECWVKRSVTWKHH